jgi:hypothetical protein
VAALQGVRPARSSHLPSARLVSLCYSRNATGHSLIVSDALLINYLLGLVNLSIDSNSVLLLRSDWYGSSLGCANTPVVESAHSLPLAA